MRFSSYVLRRAVFAVVTIFVAITLNFILFRTLPGSAVQDLTRVPHASPQLRAALTHEFGLDKSKWQQYVAYLEQLTHGNLGISFQDAQPVNGHLRSSLAQTLPWILLGTFLSIVVGVVTGFVAAWRRGGWIDYVTTTTAMVMYALPTQFLGMLLLMWLGTHFATGAGSAIDQFFHQGPSVVSSAFSRMVMPTTTLVLTLYGEYTLVVRSAMLETLGEDYILTARAKGLRPRAVVVRHALRNALLPVATLVALSLGYIVAGAILIEEVFTYPGIGYEIFKAISYRDYPVLQGAFLLLTVSVIFFNFVADLVYFKLDPRITV